MTTNTNYTEYVNIVKNLKMTESFNEVREPYKDGFELIYDKATENNVNISNAKEFLNSLTKEELSTLQNYARLVDEVNVDDLSDEGSYNLLVHHYEKYDFDNDGLIDNGKAQILPMIPQSLGNDAKKALVETFNSMDFNERMTASILLLPPPIVIDGEIAISNQDMNIEDIRNNIINLLSPANKKNSTQEFKDIIQKFSEIFEQNYKKTLEEKAYYNIK